uniref:(northern house mosquito) hypothetical protein n=1 Tax=Culex pipiens TaxID=7175 RepID=A0A8D8DXU5_CULPI
MVHPIVVWPRVTNCAVRWPSSSTRKLRTGHPQDEKATCFAPTREKANITGNANNVTNILLSISLFFFQMLECVRRLKRGGKRSCKCEHLLATDRIGAFYSLSRISCSDVVIK